MDTNFKTGIAVKNTEDVFKAAETIAAHGEVLKTKKFVIGFDGFVDEIIHAVATRKNKNEYERIKTIAEFGARISSAAGKSANIELVPQLVKIGGNGPLMAMAASGMGCDVTCIGLMGYPTIHPVFDTLEKICKVISVGNPGHTDALEFLDGKLMLGKLNTIKDMNWNRLVEVIGKEALKAIFAQADMVACTNWTMITEMGEILEHIHDIIPEKSKAHFFFDLADPEKRPVKDLEHMLHQIQALNKKAKCVLGLNLREAEQVSRILGVTETPKDSTDGVREAAERISTKMGLHGMVVHAVKYAGAFVDGQSDGIAGPYCASPKLSTGAGDHFNGGFCSGLLAGLDVKDALYSGVGASGWYVRNGRSPKNSDVVELLQDWAGGNLLA